LTKFVRAVFAKFCTDRFQYEFKECSNAWGADVPTDVSQTLVQTLRKNVSEAD